MSLLVSLWLLWLLLWLVFTIILIKQSRDLLRLLADSDGEYEFPGWRIFLLNVWRREYLNRPDSGLHQQHDDYRKLLNIWVFIAALVIMVRFMILVMHG